jgi:hypothetical protein
MGQLLYRQTSRGVRGPSLATASVLAICAASLLSAAPAQAAFDPSVVSCRAAVGKGMQKITKAMTRAVTRCHQNRARDAAFAPTDCNDLSAADPAGSVAATVAKVRASIASGKCAGVSPASALYGECPNPCSAAVPSMNDFGNVVDCIACVAEREIEAMAVSIHGIPASPLASGPRRCGTSIGSSSSKAFQALVKTAARCQAREESAGGTSADFCTNSAFPTADGEDAIYNAENRIVDACDLESFEGLDTCDETQFGIAICVGTEVRDAAHQFVANALAPGSLVTTTTTSTTTTSLPPVEQDPTCPDRGELRLYSHDSNIACSTNAECAAPRTCDTSIGICVSKSDLDSGWTGHAHDSDLDNGVIQRSYLLCPGPGPTCGECFVDGIDPTGGSCRCANDTRAICDEPFKSDADDCGGATCDCYFGVPIPLSSAGTPACIVNRYAQDITGTANVDTGDSEISAKLRTRVYLGISTLNPCAVCGGKCSNNPATACVIDADCGTGNSCIDDTPHDGSRDGLCIGGQNNGLSCDVAGINPSFPAIPGGVDGGGGYSLDCMPSSGINISGAGLALNVTQSTGVREMHANIPCLGGDCFCKTCSASPQSPCNSNGDCTGGSCAVSSNFQCTQDTDCDNLNLGTCSGIKRCTLATARFCDTNADCQNQDGGACNPSSCTALGGGGVQPEPSQCETNSCTPDGEGTGTCTVGPDDRTCDGLVRANGKGILSCSNNADCQANDPLNGNCTLIKRRPCFVDPIVATGVASTDYPVGAAIFCVPPTSNGSINQVAGLPGPARVLNQGESAAFCASDPLVEYEPGVGGCPVPTP